ncbi:winged helix DNA-binding domain-containing protein [Streptomyces sp. ISL-10]|uniref:DNA glycosylase AlkZ-like family protein n=1 Tax=Streptomyces sp. ISL-10 TaxID=2819172 RepID=UPI001BE67DBB|nr:crosslink repair DNA glycosylase YcaQ family protein [Streptomyces sp. ISL-10]MBT2365900.1 winged helix DNA-binding domain-containing protein [Streptomyces sp. ISL-10]
MNHVEPAQGAFAVTRAQVLNHRAAVHQIDRPAGDPLCEGVLLAGVQDSPPGRTADVALRARGQSVDPAHLALVHSMRAATHLHRAADLACLAAALRPDDARDLAKEQVGPFGQELSARHIAFGDAVDQVAEAMRAATADRRARTKGELSTALNEIVDAQLRPWCPGCAAHHVQDTLFRYATLQAGLCITVDAAGPFHYLKRPTRRRGADAQQSRHLLVRRFLRWCGPARPADLAKWLALTPAAARRLWEPFGDELSEVTVDGRRGWMHQEDLDALHNAPAATGVRLLPSYDPLTEIADRELLLPDRAQRATVWRATAAPGVLVVRGEITGTWRQRSTARRVTVTLQPFRTLTATERHAARHHAEELNQEGGRAVEIRFVS